MENVKDFFLEELKKLTGDGITENDKRHLNTCIRMFKTNGLSLQEMLELVQSEDVKEYIAGRWDVIHSL